jgi:hypothetical protein
MAGSVLVMGAVGVVSAVSLDGISLGSHQAPPTASGPVEGIGPQAVGPQPVGPEVVPPPAAAPAPAAPAPLDPTAGLPGPGSIVGGTGSSSSSGSSASSGAGSGSGSSASSGESARGKASTPARRAPAHSSPADRRIGRFTGNDRTRATEGRAESDDRSDGDDSDDATESRRDRDARRVAHACQVAAQVFHGPWDADDCVEYVGRHRASN